jgi:hypothetical protein
MCSFMCFCSIVMVLMASMLRAVAADTAATSVTTHLGVISWYSGTFACTSKTTYSNGKSETYKWTVITSDSKDGWLHYTVKGETGGDYYGYDPKKDKYVILGVGGPGDYAAGYFTVGKDRSISASFDNEFSSTSTYSRDVWKITPTADGYTIVESGPTHILPGLRFQEVGACVRQ